MTFYYDIIPVCFPAYLFSHENHHPTLLFVSTKATHATILLNHPTLERKSCLFRGFTSLRLSIIEHLLTCAGFVRCVVSDIGL
jgi:hypothetical protein